MQVVFFLFFIVLPVLCAAKESDRYYAASDFYYYQGQKIPLHRSLTRCVVKFQPWVRKQEQASVLTGFSVPGEVVKEISVGELQFAIIRWRSGASKADKSTTSVRFIEETLDQLRARPEVEFVSPLYISAKTRTPMFPTGEILVKLKPGQKIEELVARYATWGLEVKEKLWGTQDEYVLRSQNLKAVDPLEAANVLFESGLVEWAEPNFAQEVQKSFTPNDPFFPLQWHLDNLTKPQADVEAPKAWDITQGSPNIVIAIIDDGVELNHPDLVDNIFSNPREFLNGRDDDGNGFVDDLWGWDFRDNDNNPNPSFFDDDHGTAVAGVAAARGNNGIGVSGVCPRCKILPVRIGFGFFFTNDKAANAIRYAASLADVLNNSWGGSAPSSVIHSAIRDAVTRGRGGKGSVVLSAAGNSASGYELISVSGLPAGTHRFRWVYSKDFIFSSGEDTAWLGWVQFPGGQVENFEAGAASWLTGWDAPWWIVNDPTHADEGACFTYALKAGAIGHNQSSWVEIVKTVPAGDLRYFAWVSSELGFDGLQVYIDLYNNGTFDRFGEFQSGELVVVPGVSYPAAYPESFAVGASSDLNCRSHYSQFGADLDFVEPSNGGFFNRAIYTTDRTGFWGYDFFSDYALFGGTSSATPVVSGIVGLLLSKNPNLTQAQVRQILRDTADKIGPSPYVNGRNDRYGFGRVNAFNALNAADSMTCPPIQGEVAVNHVFKTILFAASCENPVVIVGPPTYHDTQPGVIRLHNVNQNGFDIRFQEWNYLDGKHASEHVPYLVLRQGRHTMSDGSVWEVGTFALNGTGTWIAKNFTAPFAGAPVLFLTVQTANDAQPVMVRARNVTPAGFEAALFEEEALMNGHSTETIGYLAIYNPKGWGSIDFRGTQAPYLIQRLGVNHLFAPVLSSNLKLEEEQSKDLETNHVVEKMWALALGDKLFAQVVSFNGPDTIALRRIAPKYERSIEWGIVHGVNHDWVQVPLAKTYTNPVVAAKPASSVGPDPGVIRLKEVTTRSFQLRYQEWNYLDGRHLPEKIFYLVADSGAYTVGGLTVNAGKTNSSALSRFGQWRTISFSTTFTNFPVVFSAVQTVNDSDAVITRLRNISAASMQIAMDEQEGKNDGHTSETLGWIAISQGSGATSDGRRLMASLLDGVTHVPSLTSFFTSLTRIYPIVVSDLATVRESDPVFLRYQNPTSGSIELYLQEEQSADMEMSHVAEKVGVFVAE